MKTFEIKIEGVTPLLFNRFIQSSIENKVKKRVGSTKEILVEDKLYKDGEGNICIPSTWVYGSLVEAGKAFKIQGKGKSTYSKLIGSSVMINPEMSIVKPQDWDNYTISAVNPMTRGRIMVTRPRLNKWEVVFKIDFDEDDLPIEVLKNIVDYAGQYTGIGDWRPAKKGQFGKFIVTSFKSCG